MAPRSAPVTQPFDAILLFSFGGPEGPDDVLPFLENVTRGRGVPRERLLEVAEHYQHFGGVSPITAQNRALVAALEAELAAHGPQLPVYFGNRHWHPFVEDALRQMKADGVRRALVFVTSAFSSYSGCRAYREDLERARIAIGDGAPEVHKLRVFFDHPRFLDAVTARVQEAVDASPPDAALVFTAHSVPVAMARTSRYEAQLRAAAAIVAERVGRERFELVWQSRSGPPSVPWLEPDIGDHLRALAAQGVTSVVVSPLGFLSDHMEVAWDLDEEARVIAAELGLAYVRAGTPGTHPAFVTAIRELVLEQLEGAPRHALTVLGEGTCAADCCPAPARPPAARPSA
jgi:ferrochelatase